MPVISSDIIWYGAAVSPLDDVATNIGGSIDTTKKITFTRIGTPTTLEMLSSAGGDTTQQITIYYLDNTGALASETKQLNGTNVVSFTATMATFLRVVKGASTTGTVTVRKGGAGATIVTLESSFTSAQLPFYNQLIDPAAQTDRYDKLFCKNTHGTLAVLSASILIVSDAQNVITTALEAVLNGSSTNGVGNTRLVAPAGYTFDQTSKSVANSGSLTAGSAQGIWLRSRLGTSLSPFDDTFTLRLSGISA